MGESSEKTAVLLIAHGSRHQAANDDLHALAERLAAEGEHPIVEACFLELAEPDIVSGANRCVVRGAARVLMVPYFLSAGVHLLRDLTRARKELSRSHPGVEFRLGPPLGPHPLLDALVAARIGELESGAATCVVVSSEEAIERYAPKQDVHVHTARADHS
jgi:sirohydrochlorin ferrochelatase